MRDRVWWKQLHWFEYGAELLGTAFLVFAGVSAVVFVFGFWSVAWCDPGFAAAGACLERTCRQCRVWNDSTRSSLSPLDCFPGRGEHDFSARTLHFSFCE